MQRFVNVWKLAVLLFCIVPAANAAAADAQVRYVITNGGVDVKDKGQVHYLQGGHDGTVVTWAGSGDTAQIPAGAYDVHVTFSDGAAAKDIWLDNQTFSGKVDKTVEMGLKLTDVRYVITNGGVDTKDKGQVHYRQGGHDGTEVAWANSGDTVRIPAGTYDVHVTFSDGSATKDIWLDDQTFSGKVEKSVEVGVNVAEVRYLITNGGADTKDKGQVHYRQGGHDGTEVAWARSGDTVRLPAGPYDVHVTFSDGSAAKDMWLDNQSFSGKVDKTVEIGLKLADVRYLINNGGADVKDDGQAHFRQGGHDGTEVAWTRSGDTVRLAAGIYDVDVIFSRGLVRKELWFDNQSFSGTVQRAVEMGVVFTQPTVTVTQNGTDVGDKASVDYFVPATDNDLGGVRSSQPALLQQGTYDVRATLGAAEGWLRKVALTGKPHLTIPVAIPKSETLQAGAPPPKACRIEVYGVNFDFNKADLRPDSEPVLREVLALFVGAPSFSAEVSGHTDNIGTSAYNMKLSDARAAAVKTWLVSHGVAATRVTSRGYGDTQPLVPNTSDANRFKNRRVELRRTNCG